MRPYKFSAVVVFRVATPLLLVAAFVLGGIIVYRQWRYERELADNTTSTRVQRIQIKPADDVITEETL